MKKRILLVTIAFAIALGTVWWLGIQGHDSTPLDVGETGPESRDAIEGAGTDTLSEGASQDSVAQSVDEESLAGIQKMEPRWEERYPGSEVVEKRILRVREGEFRRQSLLKTKVERIPWVLWEETLRETQEGEIVFIRSVAHMGNVVYVDADPESVTSEKLSAFMEANDLYIERESRFSEYKSLGVRNPELGKLESLVEAFEEQFPGVIAELEPIHFTSAFPSDWSPSRMWGLQSISAPDAWEFETGEGAEKVVVAVIDTGVETAHPDLAANILKGGQDFVDADSIPQDNDGHGTHVAGIVGAVGDNGQGAVGVSWNVKILPLRVGNVDGLRNSAINDALAYVAKLKEENVNIVATNNSYGSFGYSSATRAEIAKHQNLGILFVAASGNDGVNIDLNVQYPAGYDLSNIISVGNSNQENGLNGSSNYGATNVDLSAPGSEIFSTYLGNSYTFLSGTSMASPMVAGAAALVAQANPEMTGPQIKRRLMDTADRIPSQAGRSVTGGRLNLLAALRPELSGHELSVSNIKDGIVLLDSLESQPIFYLDYKVGANLSASILSGDSMGKIVDLGSGRFRFDANQEGMATVRFVAELGGIEKSVEKTIVFGTMSDVTNGLIHHFDFSGSGSTVTDKAGNSNGTIVGATRMDSEFGSSARFDNTNEKVSFSGKFRNRVTITALVRSDNMQVSPHPRIVNMPFYYLYFSSGVGADVPDGNRRTLKFYSHFETGGAESFGVWNAPPNSVKDNQWYFVTATYDGNQVANTPELFINGAPQPVWMQQSPSGTLTNPGGLSYLGNNGDDTRAYEGSMADIRVYDRELSGEEVTQLAVSLIGNRWQDTKILGPESVELGSEYEFTVQLDDSVESAVEVNWVGENGNDVQVVSRNGTEATLRLGKLGSQKLQAQVSDGMVTYVVAETVATSNGDLQTGNYVGQTSSGGFAMLEVAPDLATGTISLFDPETGFYRIREAVTIDGTGSFETVEDSVGRIEGTALYTLVGQVKGYGVTFEGEIQTVLNSSALEKYEGDYFGGTLDVAGDSIHAEVLGNGNVFIWRTGPEADFAIGLVSSEGGLDDVSSRGLKLSLSLDDVTGEIVGTWGGYEIFLAKDAAPTSGELWGGAFGGVISGNGSDGFFGRLVYDRTHLSEESLGKGIFALDGAGSFRAGPFVVTDSRGRLIYGGTSSRETSLNDLSTRLESADWTSSKVEGIRIQSPIVEEGFGVIGFSIRGDDPLEVLARGLGRAFSVRGGEDPELSLYELVDGELSLVATNENWRDGALFTGEGENSQGAFLELMAGFEELELTTFPDEAKDAAFRVWLDSGDYLLVLELSSGEPGVGLLEVFDLN